MEFLDCAVAEVFRLVIAAHGASTTILAQNIRHFIVKVCTGKSKDVTPIMWVIFVLFALRIVTLVTNFM